MRSSLVARLSSATIRLYQRHVSPRKGFCCAHRLYTGEVSCSQFALDALRDRGFLAALPEVRTRFRHCREAALALGAGAPGLVATTSGSTGDSAAGAGALPERSTSRTSRKRRQREPLHDNCSCCMYDGGILSCELIDCATGCLPW